jgi:signal transduction histidine kinase
MLRKRVVAQTEIIGAQLQRDAILGERQRLARDFHDTLEQELTGIAIQLDNVDGRFEPSPGKAREALQLARQMLRYCREEVRTSISDLRCVLLEHGGLESALREALPPLVTASNTAFTFNVSGTPFRIDSAVENHLLRMAREAVTNAVRHSSATHIDVELAFTPQSVRLSVNDDGQGFDATLRPPRGHFGLQGMHERAKKIGAALQIESTPGSGTAVRVTVSEERLHRNESGGRTL